MAWIHITRIQMSVFVKNLVKGLSEVFEGLRRVSFNDNIQFDLIEIHLTLKQWDRKANILKSPNFHLKWGTKFLVG